MRTRQWLLQVRKGPTHSNSKSRPRSTTCYLDSLSPAHSSLSKTAVQHILASHLTHTGLNHNETRLTSPLLHTFKHFGSFHDLSVHAFLHINSVLLLLLVTQFL